MALTSFFLRPAQPTEYNAIGELLVEVYAQLPGFTTPAEQPAYYRFLANVGALAERPGIVLLVAVDEANRLAGAVVYVGDMRHYSPLGIAAHERDAAGIRLLAVAPWARGQQLGKLLSQECIRRARAQGATQVVLHSTSAMPIAWRMYEQLGFVRDPALDFLQGDLGVHGFRLPLAEASAHR